MSTQLMQLLAIAAIVGPVLGLFIGILVGFALAHVRFLNHATRGKMEDLHYR